MESIVEPKQVYTYQIMLNDIKLLKQTYPFLVVEEIGMSVDERKIIAVKIGNGSRPIMLNGAHHAREWMTTALLMHMLEYYCKTYTENQLDDLAIWFVPMVNPDGVTLVQEGVEQFAEKDFLLQLNENSIDFASWKANIRGVDLNRQYPVDWEHIDDYVRKPSKSMYKGPSPLSEPEARALYDFTILHQFHAVACYHSSGEEIFWKYKADGKLIEESLKLANQLVTATGYTLIDPGENPSGGGFTDWFLMKQKRPSFTMEIAPYVGPRPVPLEFYEEIWEKNKHVGLILGRNV